MVLAWACKEKETDYTENDLIIAAYLPHWGMDNVDMNSLRHLDILYYFSIAADQDGLFTLPEGMVSDLNSIKDKTSFLIEIDIGGIMAWELSQDVPISSPYSLFDAILDVAGR